MKKECIHARHTGSFIFLKSSGTEPYQISRMFCLGGLNYSNSTKVPYFKVLKFEWLVPINSAKLKYHHLCFPHTHPEVQLSRYRYSTRGERVQFG